jgi:hypothetical protein
MLRKETGFALEDILHLSSSIFFYVSHLFGSDQGRVEDDFIEQNDLQVGIVHSSPCVAYFSNPETLKERKVNKQK